MAKKSACYEGKFQKGFSIKWLYLLDGPQQDSKPRVHRKLMQMDINKLLKSPPHLYFQSYYPLCLPKCKQYQLLCFTDVLNL